MTRFADVRRCSSRSALLLAMTLVAVGGCTSATFGNNEDGGTQRRSQDLITNDEILTRPDSDAYTLIRALRPGWLRARPASSFLDTSAGLPYVYLDLNAYGALESLYQISSTTIDRIEFISANEATTLYGTGYPGGIIRVITKRGG